MFLQSAAFPAGSSLFDSARDALMAIEHIFINVLSRLSPICDDRTWGDGLKTRDLRKSGFFDWLHKRLQEEADKPNKKNIKTKLFSHTIYID